MISWSGFEARTSCAAIGAVAALAACGNERPIEPFYEPPAAVVVSFKNFADSVAPQLYRRLDSAGIYLGWIDMSNGGSRPLGDCSEIPNPKCEHALLIEMRHYALHPITTSRTHND
jgi:predicted small lipoprotein YifL